jgi:hypothetical protein
MMMMTMMMMMIIIIIRHNILPILKYGCFTGHGEVAPRWLVPAGLLVHVLPIQAKRNSKPLRWGRIFMPRIQPPLPEQISVKISAGKQQQKCSYHSVWACKHVFVINTNNSRLLCRQQHTVFPRTCHECPERQ